MKFLLLLMFWIILCEKISLEIVVFGIIFSFLISYINSNVFTFMHLSNFFKFNKVTLYVKFIFLLIKEIFIANIQVAKIVLNPRISISPCLVKFKTTLKNNLSKTILANSITLTPGTITVSIDGDEFIIHCLNEEYGESLTNSTFEKLLIQIEEK